MRPDQMPRQPTDDAYNPVETVMTDDCMIDDYREPTMDDAVAAGNGTLHGAIDYWQERALRAERTLVAYEQAIAEASDVWITPCVWIKNRASELLAANA